LDFAHVTITTPALARHPSGEGNLGSTGRVARSAGVVITSLIVGLLPDSGRDTP